MFSAVSVCHLPEVGALGVNLGFGNLCNLLQALMPLDKLLQRLPIRGVADQQTQFLDAP